MTANAPVELYENRLVPITWSIGFLKVPLNEASDSLRQWRAEIHGSANAIPLVGGLIENVHRLEPLTGRVRPRELLVATSSRDWTAFFDCGVHGGDQVSTIGYMARRLQCQGLVIASIPGIRPGDRSEQPYGALQFEMFGPVETDFLNYVRTISLTQDGKRWRFDTSGTVQHFEDLSAYERRRFVDRFTPSMLAEYSQALGLNPFDEKFYAGPSCLIRNPSEPAPGALVLSLVEAERRARGC